jgi:hypothetical protein
MESPKRVVLAFDKLRKVNFRRAQKYREGAEQASGLQIKSLFSDFVKQSETFKVELQRHCSAATSAPLPTSSFWEGMVTSLRIRARRAISISEFEQMEDESLHEYRQVMRCSYVPIDALQDIAHQMEAIEKAKGILQDLRSEKTGQLSPISI